MILTILAICCAILALSLFCVAAGITPEDAARLTVQGATFLPCYLRALAGELMPESAEPAPPAEPGVFIHNGQLYRYDGVSVMREPTTQPTRQAPPKRP